MSSFKKHFWITLLFIGLAGCFRPMYMENNTFNESLKSVYIEPINTRLGIEIRNEILFQLNSTVKEGTAKYRLEIQITETGIISIVDTVTGLPQAYATGLKANYKLYKKDNDKTPIHIGSAIADTSYDRTQQRYAALRAARDAQDRSAKVIAEQIKLKLISYFASQDAQ